MEQEGIKFICNANVGENVEPQMFLKEYHATVICNGATQPRDLPIEGRSLQGDALRELIFSPPIPRRCSMAAPPTA